jgi:Trypsin-like peptidase domain
MRCGPFVVLLALLAGGGPALAQSASSNPNPAAAAPTVKKHRAVRKTATPPAPAAAAKPVPKTETAKKEAAKPAPAKAETAEVSNIPPAERLKIQSALYWSGDYSAAAKADDAMGAAIRNFQRRSKARITGVLTSEQRTALIAAADAHAQEFGWSVVVDPATGVRIGLPTKLVPVARDAAHGTHWSSPHGEVQVETFRVKNAKLSALFEEEKKKPKRKIEHSVLNDDGFIVSGMQGLKYFTVRAKLRDGEVRGFTLLYDQMMEGIVAPVMVAMASAFSPFPERPAPFAALAKKVEYGTGLIVSAEGHIVTARKVAEGCQVIVADGLGNAERVAQDEANGLALLRVYGARKLPALTLARDPPKAGDITLIGIPDPKEQDGGKKLTEIKAKLTDGAAIALREPVPMAGFSGAAALDAKGQFVGVMETRNFVLASADPALPPVRLIPAAAIRDFLVKQHVAANGANADARAAAVRIICVRK